MGLNVIFNFMIAGLQRDNHRQRGDHLQYHLPEEHRGDQFVFSKITQLVFQNTNPIIQL